MSSLPRFTTVSFWCERCRKDFDATAIRQESFRHNEQYWCAFCKKCNNKCVRYITRQSDDPYYLKSEKLRRMRQQYSKDILQPGQTGYNTIYGDPFKEWYNKLEQEERRKWEGFKKDNPGLKRTVKI